MTTSLTPFIDRAREALIGYTPHTLDAAGTRPAAVLLLLYHNQGEDRILFTRRTDTVEHHKGQISFPGGGVHDADADRSVTALRETWEEVGVHPDDVEIIGRLDDLTTITDFLVAPYVGVLKRVPYEFVPSEIEVAEILEVPIPHLVDPANVEMEVRQREGEVRLAPAYVWQGHRIWGATAMMLHGFLDLLQTTPPGDGA